MNPGEYEDATVRFERNFNPGIRFGIREKAGQIAASTAGFGDYLNNRKKVRF
jgi:hypothetical protein